MLAILGYIDTLVCQPTCYLGFICTYNTISPTSKGNRAAAGSPLNFYTYPPLQVLLAILDYIDTLVALVRPTNLLFLAVDGPAPRAKMNQQRTRRFKSAAEAQEKERIKREIADEWRAAGKEPPGGGKGGGGGSSGGGSVGGSNGGGGGGGGSGDVAGSSGDGRGEDVEGSSGGGGGGVGSSGEGEGAPDALADSNVITPGTPFMATLGRWLRYYAYAKLNGERPNGERLNGDNLNGDNLNGAQLNGEQLNGEWPSGGDYGGGFGGGGSGGAFGSNLPTGEYETRRNDGTGLRIILSDASVPGEGEHKICHYVRVQRQAAAEAMAAGGRPRALHHAIHGLDADLIMLALATREPRFSIVREVQSRGRRRRGPAFELLRVHVLREYLTKELGTGCDWSGNR